jgi:NADH-quinone oxidoreductase subunit N
MSLTDLITILPLLVLAGGAVLIMLVLAVYRNHTLTLILTVLTLVFSLAALDVSSLTPLQQVTSLLVFDSYSFFFMALVFGAALAVCILSFGYMAGRRNIKEEFYILVLLASLGCAGIIASTHFISFFLSLEILSVSLYVLIAYPRSEPDHIEAGIKYLIPAATSVAFLLLGAAFIYAYCGTMSFSGISFHSANVSVTHNLFLLAGLVLVVIGIGFKLALVPFHLWTPDVYQGAPAPVAGFIATASKGAVFALLLRYWTTSSISDCKPVFTALVAIAIVTMLFGNLLALLQNNVKRILAYSSIAHIGYLLTALLAGGALAIVAVSLYLLTYFITTLGAFGVITVLSGKQTDIEMLDDYRGLSSRHPYLAGIFTGFLFSLAGIPLTAGFIGKFYIFSANVNAQLWLLLIVLIISSVIGLFYYLRIIVALYKPADETQTMSASVPSLSFAGGLILILLTAALLIIGIYPSPVIGLVKIMTSGLGGI